MFSDRFRTVSCCGRAAWRLLNAAWCRGQGLGAALSGAGLAGRRDRLLCARRAALGQGPCWRLGSHGPAGQHVGWQRPGRAGAMDWRLSSPGACRKHEAVSRSPGLCLLCGSRTGGAGQQEGSVGRGSGLCPVPRWAGRAVGSWCCACSAPRGPCPAPAPPAEQGGEPWELIPWWHGRDSHAQRQGGAGVSVGMASPTGAAVPARLGVAQTACVYELVAVPKRLGSVVAQRLWEAALRPGCCGCCTPCPPRG